MNSPFPRHFSFLNSALCLNKSASCSCSFHIYFAFVFKMPQVSWLMAGGCWVPVLFIHRLSPLPVCSVYLYMHGSLIYLSIDWQQVAILSNTYIYIHTQVHMYICMYAHSVEGMSCSLWKLTPINPTIILANIEFYYYLRCCYTLHRCSWGVEKAIVSRYRLYSNMQMYASIHWTHVPICVCVEWIIDNTW